MADETLLNGAVVPPRVENLPSGREANGRFTEGTPIGAETRFRPGEPGPALTHGGRSRLAAAGALLGQAEAVAAAEALREGVECDKGGADALSTLERDAIATYVELALQRDCVVQHLRAVGPLTPRGRVRGALTALLKITDRQQRLAQLLGLERRARKVEALEEILARPTAEGVG